MESKIKIHMIGNAHLDPVWFWQWQEGYAEIKATFRSALDRMNEFPEFIFTCAGAAYYQWVEENAPEMFAEIKRRVHEGRWVVVGGWWIQPDCNLPSGESFVRHSLYSQRYFYEKFGLTAKVGYNVDSFGHHGMLPQILKKSGMDYYVFMRPGEHEKPIGKDLFWWESEDGSRVMTFRIPFNYGHWWEGEGDPVEEKTLAVRKMAEDHGHSYMNFYGVGNHGGGPTIANLHQVEKLRRVYGKETVKTSSPDAYFAEMAESAPELPVLKDDLQHHASGCYSAHSETKALNRSAEHRLQNAEKFAAAAHHLLKLPYPAERIRKGWENVLFNQFHDIMGGCSIKEAYEDARESYGESLHIAAVTLNAALQKISWSVDTMRSGVRSLSKDTDWMLWEQQDWGVPLVIFNPLTWDRQAAIQVNKMVRGITDEEGNPVDIQHVRGSRTFGKEDRLDTVFMGTVPAMGYRVYWIHKKKTFEPEGSGRLLAAEPHAMENDWHRLEFEPHTGFIKRLYDKKRGVEILGGKGAVPVVLDEYDSDAWATGILEFRNEIGKFADAETTLVEQGPVRVKIRVINRYGQSILRQDFMMYRDKPGIEVKVQLDWRERHKMLKLSFPVNVDHPSATYEIPYGYIARPVDGKEEPGQQWLDVSGTVPGPDGQELGLSLLNDAKYSFDVKGNDLRMTVARGAMFADTLEIRDELCEFMDQGIQEFGYALVPHEGSWRDAEIPKKANELNVPPVYVIETYHAGSLPQKMTGIRISADSVIGTVFKKAEDGDGYILRCHESWGRETHASIEIPMLDRKWTSHFGRCEIKTFRLPANPLEPVEENNLLEYLPTVSK